MIYTEALTKRYGQLVALRDLNLRVEEGEIFGLIGPNGAGKTTTMRVLATLLRPTSGRVRIAGLDLAADADEIRRLIGYMPDFAGVYEDMRVDEYLRFFAATSRITGKKAETIVGDVLALTDLAHRRGDLVEALSRGMRQRLQLARVLLHDPKVLLLDEPASGLDPRARVEIRGLLKELCAMRKTVIISSHILSELAELCTTVGIIEKGRLLFKATVAEILQRARRLNVVHARVEESAAAREALAADPRVGSVSLHGETLEICLRPEAGDPSCLSRLLVESGFRLHHFSEEPLTLEEAFMRLTEGAGRGQD